MDSKKLNKKINLKNSIKFYYNSISNKSEKQKFPSFFVEMRIKEFPAVHLVAAAMRQLSKYLANFLEKKAKRNAFFRNYICMPPAQMYNFVEVKTKMWTMNQDKQVEVKRLNEAEAIELGANLLGEFVLYTVAAIALIMEIIRQSTNEYNKRMIAKAERVAIQKGFFDLSYEVDIQDAQIMELRRALLKLGVYMREKPYVKPKIHKKDKHAQTFSKMVTKQTQTMKRK